MKNHIKTGNEVEAGIQSARKQTLDLLELAYGETPTWSKVRSQILKIFGRDGLEKIIKLYSGGDKNEKSNFC